MNELFSNTARYLHLFIHRYRDHSDSQNIYTKNTKLYSDYLGSYSLDDTFPMSAHIIIPPVLKSSGSSDSAALRFGALGVSGEEISLSTAA